MKIPGFDQLARFAVGPVVASANVAARAAHLGVLAGARGGRAAARIARGAIPGAGLAQQLAERIEDEACRAGEEASRRAAYCFDRLVGSDTPLYSSEAGESAPHEPTWLELASDTVATPLVRFAELGVAVGVDTVRAAASSPLGHQALEAFLESWSHPGEHRDSFVVVATDSGATAVRGAVSLGELALRLAMSDTRTLRKAMSEGLEELQVLATAEEMHELLPQPVAHAALREEARLVVDRAPTRFLTALERDAGGAAPRVGDIFLAMAQDARHLRVFAVSYPRVIALTATNVGKLLVAGSISFGEMEAFLEGRRWAGQAVH